MIRKLSEKCHSNPSSTVSERSAKLIPYGIRALFRHRGKM
jgi:hypothetical protein